MAFDQSRLFRLLRLHPSEPLRARIRHALQLRHHLPVNVLYDLLELPFRHGGKGGFGLFQELRHLGDCLGQLLLHFLLQQNQVFIAWSHRLGEDRLELAHERLKWLHQVVQGLCQVTQWLQKSHGGRNLDNGFSHSLICFCHVVLELGRVDLEEVSDLFADRLQTSFEVSRAVSQALLDGICHRHHCRDPCFHLRRSQRLGQLASQGHRCWGRVLRSRRPKEKPYHAHPQEHAAQGCEHLELQLH